jgi:hypothetical protein
MFGILARPRRLVAARPAGNELRVVGEVVGESEKPLDLYLLVAGETLAYSTVGPAPEGNRFELKSGVGRASGGPIEIGNYARIELVNMATLWFRAGPAIS